MEIKRLSNITTIPELHRFVHDVASNPLSSGNTDSFGIFYDPDRVLKKISRTTEKSDVVIIGQALAKNTERLSGLPYTTAKGSLSPTGLVLDKFLALFGYTINPHNTDRKTVYSTDIFKDFPGKINVKKGDIKPSKLCIDANIPLLKKELELLHPKVILLLGSIASKNFFKLFSPTSKIPNIFSSEEQKIMLNNNFLSIFSIPHPAGAQYRYNEVKKIYSIVAKKICKCLK